MLYQFLFCFVNILRSEKVIQITVNTIFFPYCINCTSFLVQILHKWALSLSHTLPYSINGHPMENKIFNPFVSVSMRFLSVSHSGMFVSHLANALLIRRGPLNPAESFVWNRLHWKKVPSRCTVAMLWHAFCSELVHSLSCTCPIRICWCPMDQICCRTTTWRATGQPEVYRTLTVCSADEYWQGMHGKQRITHVKWWSMGPNWWLTLGKTSNYIDFELR